MYTYNDIKHFLVNKFIYCYVQYNVSLLLGYKNLDFMELYFLAFSYVFWIHTPTKWAFLEGIVIGGSNFDFVNPVKLFMKKSKTKILKIFFSK